MESLVENEQLPGTSPPPVKPSLDSPPPYQPYDYSPEPQVQNQPPTLVRNVQFYEPDPPELSRRIMYSLVLSAIALIFIVPMLCAIPAIVFAMMALSKNNHVSQRVSYANTAVILTRAAYITIALLCVIGGILRATGYYGQ